MVASEGLAVLFEEEVTGEAPFYSRVEIRDDEITLARESLYSQPFSQAKWFFGANGIGRSFGYSYGYRICRDYAQSVSASAAELVLVPTQDLFPGGGLG